MMSTTVLACLLVVISGVSTIPQQSDVAPTQERIVGALFTRYIEQLSRAIRENGWDPKCIEGLEFEYDSYDGLIQVEGVLGSIKITGVSNIVVKYVHYNILTGRLNFQICLPEVHLSVGKSRTRGVIGDRGGELTVDGSLEVCNICIRGDALLRLRPGTTTLIDINVDFSVGSFESKLKVIWKRLGCLIPRDISDYVNILLNVKVSLFLDLFQNQINTILELIISQLGNNRPW